MSCSQGGYKADDSIIEALDNKDVRGSGRVFARRAIPGEPATSLRRSSLGRPLDSRYLDKPEA